MVVPSGAHLKYAAMKEMVTTMKVTVCTSMNFRLQVATWRARKALISWHTHEGKRESQHGSSLLKRIDEF
jgi:hypothetical protein